jgi:hypothetical protein
VIAAKYADNEESSSSELDNLCSGADDRSQWPLSVLMVMALISAVHSIVSIDDDETEIKRHVRSKCFRMFDVLCRLPQNVHGVDSLIESIDKHSELLKISQSRIGVGLFRVGSAINHSCNPNCVIRFSFPEADNTAALHKVTLEVIACTEIAAGDECCISYGPIYGRHTLSERQQALNRQYLFTCRCTACESEMTNRGEQYTDAAFVKAIAAIEYEICEVKRNDNFSAIVAPKSLQMMEQLFDRAAGIAGAMREIQMKKLVQLRCEYYDYCAYIFASMSKNYTAAIGYIERCIHLLVSNEIYSENDVVIGRERVKLAELYCSSGQYERSALIASRAFADLCRFVDSRDPDLASALHLMSLDS